MKTTILLCRCEPEEPWASEGYVIWRCDPVMCGCFCHDPKEDTTMLAFTMTEELLQREEPAPEVTWRRYQLSRRIRRLTWPTPKGEPEDGETWRS